MWVVCFAEGYDFGQKDGLRNTDQHLRISKIRNDENLPPLHTVQLIMLHCP